MNIGIIPLIMFRLWYLFGAICMAAFLGQGTVYLLAKRRTAHILVAIVVAISVYSAFRLFTTSIDLGTATVSSWKKSRIDKYITKPTAALLSNNLKRQLST